MSDKLTVEDMSVILDALEGLLKAADVYAVDQSEAPHPPITVVEAEALNRAIEKAHSALERVWGMCERRG